MPIIAGPLRAPVYALLVFVAATGVIVWADHRLFSLSNDLSFHYELARHYTHTWPWLARRAVDPPPLAYMAAATVGRLRGSDVIGLNIVACACLFGSYLLLLKAFAESCDSLLGVGLAVSLLAYGLAQHTIIGAEIRWNFLYPQAVGQFFVLLYLFWLCRRPRGWALEAAVSTAAAIWAGWVDGPSALEISTAFVSRQAITAVRQALADQRLDLRVAWRLAASILIPLGTLALHGRAITSESADRPPLDVGNIASMTPWLAVVLLAAAAGLALTRSRDTESPGVQFIATAGGAVGIAALVQLVLDFPVIGAGVYGERRYIFAIVTLLALTLGAFATPASGTSAPWRLPRPMLALAAPLLAAGAVFHLTPPHVAPLHYFVKYQEAVRQAVAQGALPADSTGAVISQNRTFPENLNLAVSKVDLGAARGPVRYAFVLPGGAPIASRCQHGSLAFLDTALVSTECLKGSSFDLYPGQSLDMAKFTDRPPYFESGWGPKEPLGLWNQGAHAVISVRVNQPPDPIPVSLGVNAFLAPPSARQHVLASIAGRSIGSWTFDASHRTGALDMNVPRALAPEGLVRIDLFLSDVSPTQPRGIFVQNLSISFGRRARPGYKLDLATVRTKPDYFVDGWSGKEDRGLWSDGKRATLLIDVGQPRGDIALTLAGNAWIPDRSYVQHATVAADGHEIARWTFDAKTAIGARTVVVPKAAIHDGLVNLQFIFPDASSPAQHGLSTDSRALAFFVTSVSVADAGAQP